MGEAGKKKRQKGLLSLPGHRVTESQTSRHQFVSGHRQARAGTNSSIQLEGKDPRSQVSHRTLGLLLGCGGGGVVVEQASAELPLVRTSSDFSLLEPGISIHQVYLTAPVRFVGGRRRGAWKEAGGGGFKKEKVSFADSVVASGLDGTRLGFWASARFGQQVVGQASAAGGGKIPMLRWKAGGHAKNGQKEPGHSQKGGARWCRGRGRCRYCCCYYCCCCCCC